jgi:predicted nucleic acid-binding protein
VKLIDTSTWVDFLRSGTESEAGKRVGNLLRRNEAAWCDMIRLELWNGVGGSQDRKNVQELEETVVHLETDARVWDLGIGLARRARADLLIAACALRHGLEVDSTDSHFKMLDKLR